MDESLFHEIVPEIKSDAEDEDALFDHNQVGLAEDNLVRIVALVGHIHHGKTEFMDMLIEQARETVYTDTRIDKQDRRIYTPTTLVLENSNSKSYLCHILDTPGHVNSSDVTASDVMMAALRLADSAVLIVDAAEGVRVNTERAICLAIQQRLPIVVVINKVDRLITELRLPPKDAYHKLRHIIEAINTHISAFSSTAGNVQLIDPTVGNVCFASAIAGWSFTLLSFAKLYVKLHGISFDAHKFASRLWGDYYFDHDTRGFKKKQPSIGVERSFVQFVLEPLYKIYSLVIGEHKKGVEATPAELGVTLSNAAMPLLRFACSSFFGSATGFTDMLVHHTPSEKVAALNKVGHIYNGLKRDRDEGEVDVPRKLRFKTTCVDHDNRELIAIRKREAKDFCCGFKYDPSRGSISLACSYGVISWTAKSSGIVWVGMHGLDSICVVTRTGDLDMTRVLESLRHHTKESVLRNFRNTVISELEDFASDDSELIEYIHRMVPKPFGVVSVILGSDQVDKESGLETSSAVYDVNAAIKFLKKEMEGSTLEETIKTAISAFRLLFQNKEFKADEIEVSVLDPDCRVRHLGMSDIEGYLAPVYKPVSPSSSSYGSGGQTIDKEPEIDFEHLGTSSDLGSEISSEVGESEIDFEQLGTSSDLGLESSSEVEMLSEELEMLSEELEMLSEEL